MHIYINTHVINEEDKEWTEVHASLRTIFECSRRLNASVAAGALILVADQE
jgi:hypothetical protein